MPNSDIVRQIDANFNIPEGLKNVEIKPEVEEDDSEHYLEDSVDFDLQDDSASEEESERDDKWGQEELQPPDSMTVVSQTLRTAKDGSQVVDVVIEVPDVPGAVNYEVRISKA